MRGCPSWIRTMRLRGLANHEFTRCGDAFAADADEVGAGSETGDVKLHGIVVHHGGQVTVQW